jgi:hypothetical protein
VVDLQTGERTEFLCNRWLACEKEDGEVITGSAQDQGSISILSIFTFLQIERVIQASGDRGCQQMMFHSAANHIKENHLWFSIFMRNPRSRFTRLQRTSTAFALLFLSMLVDAMW